LSEKIDNFLASLKPGFARQCVNTWLKKLILGVQKMAILAGEWSFERSLLHFGDMRCCVQRTYLNKIFQKVAEKFWDRFFDAERRQYLKNMAERSSKKDAQNFRKIQGNFIEIGSST